MPTPMLSWAVRELKCQAGIVYNCITQSCKVQWLQGLRRGRCQITPGRCKHVIGKINAVENVRRCKGMDFEDGIKSGKIEYIKQEVIDKYLDKVAQQGVHTRPCSRQRTQGCIQHRSTAQKQACKSYP